MLLGRIASTDDDREADVDLVIHGVARQSASRGSGSGAAGWKTVDFEATRKEVRDGERTPARSGVGERSWKAGRMAEGEGVRPSFAILSAARGKAL